MRTFLRAFCIITLLATAPLAVPAQDTATSVVQRYFDLFMERDFDAMLDLVAEEGTYTATRWQRDSQWTIVRRNIVDHIQKTKDDFSTVPPFEFAVDEVVSLSHGQALQTVSASWNARINGTVVVGGIDVFSLALIDGSWKIVQHSALEEIPGRSQ